MKKLHFTYEMRINYSEEVAKCNYTIKCIPKDTLRQEIDRYHIELFPSTRFCRGVDGLRNLQIYGVNEQPHTVFIFKLEGDVFTGLCDYEEETVMDIDMVFRHPHGLNRAGESIKCFFQQNPMRTGLNDYERSVEWMHALHKHFQYVPFSTNVDTSAEEAFAQGRGVCQDYSHIFIALLHLAGISARYVTGMIVGEGASHSWVEVLWNGKWYGLDPTNNHSVSDDYIKIGVGRDAKDCMINRGIMHGGGCQTQDIRVSVIEIQESKDSEDE